MDLHAHSIVSATNAWERVRARTFGDILSKHATPLNSLVDFVCGSGYMTSALSQALELRRTVGIDLSMTTEQMLTQGTRNPPVEFVSDPSHIAGESFDALTLFDTIGLFPNDSDLLSTLISGHKLVRPGGWVFISVPAYPGLFGRHDVSNKHYRRYSRKSLRQLANSASLEIVDEGNLFHSLVVPRVVANVMQTFKGQPSHASQVSTSWPFSGRVDRFLETVWSTEAKTFSKAPVDGLTIWALCRKADTN